MKIKNKPAGKRTFLKVRLLPSLCLCAAVLLLAGNPMTASAGLYEAVLSVFGPLINSTTVPQDEEHLPLPTGFVREVHDSLPFIADLHSDRIVFQPAGDPHYQMMFGPVPGGPPVYQDLFHVDVPRLLQGNVALQVLSVFNKGSIDSYAREIDALGVLVRPLTRCELTGVAERDGECHRADWNRDPERFAYDDPGIPYARNYGFLNLDRDPLNYLDWVQGWPCEFWYDPRVGLLSDPDGCPDFDARELYMKRLLLRARLVREAVEIDPRVMLVRTAEDLHELRQAREGGAELVGVLIAAEGIHFPNQLKTPFHELVDPGTGRLRASGHLKDPAYAKIVYDFERLYEAGYRMMGLTHFLDNDYGGSSTGMGKFGSGYAEQDPGHVAAPDPADDRLGLSDTGRVWVQLMLEHGVVIDLAHAAPPLISHVTQAAMTAGVPVISSHGGISTVPGGSTDICRRPRNLDDDQILRIAATGGVVGVGFDPGFTCGDTPADVARTMRHAMDVIDGAGIRKGFDTDSTLPLLRGADHVALGSDFDGGITSPVDAAHLNKITEALICRDGNTDPDAPAEIRCTGLRRAPGDPVEIVALDQPLDPMDGPGAGVSGSSLSRVLGENTFRVIEEVLACRADVCGRAGEGNVNQQSDGGCGCSVAGRKTYGSAPVLLGFFAALFWLAFVRTVFGTIIVFPARHPGKKRT